MTRVLVPVAILDGETVSSGLMTLLGTVDVTVLGYHVIPEQTPPDQARLQFEDRATAALDDLAEEFRAAGGDADHRLVFTRDRGQSVDRIADEIGADAFGISGVTGDVDQILVSLTGTTAAEQILTFVERLIGDREMGVTLFASTDDEAKREQVRDGRERLGAAGIATETMIVGGESPFEQLVDNAPNHDAIVMGESAPSVASFLLGAETDRVAATAVCPVLVVRTESE